MSRARLVSQLVGANTALGNTTISGALSTGNTTISGALATGNTVITGTANVSSTLAAGNTTIVGFANVSGYGSGTFAPYNDPLVVKGQDYTYLHLQGTNNQAAIIYNKNGTTGWFHGLDNSGNMVLNTMASMNGTGVGNAKDGTPALFVDTSGRVKKPSQPAFDAYGTVGNVLFTTETPLPLDSTTFNIGSHYSTSTFRFTAPVAGIYFFRAQVYKQGSGNASRLRLYKNGSNARVYQYISSSDVYTHSITGIISLAVNDYVTCTFNGDGAGTNIYLADNHTNFSGYFLG